MNLILSLVLGRCALALAVQPDAPPPPVTLAPTTFPSPSPQPATSTQRVNLQSIFARLRKSLSLRELQRAALREAGLDRNLSANRMRRVRLSSILPTFQSTFDHRVDNGWALDQAPGVGDDLKSDAGTAQVYKLKATWNLDRLLFNPDELRVARAAMDISDWRRQLLVEITQLYFEREGLLVELELSRNEALAELVAREIRVREIEWLLSSMTGIEINPTPTTTGPTTTVHKTSF